jgi:hypothetical protein
MPEADRQLKPANENPWYVLMTLFGVPIFPPNEDQKLENTVVWNAWACQNMSVAQRKKLANNLKLEPELIGDWEEIKEGVQLKFAQEWASRNARGLKRPPLPSPDQNILLNDTDFGGGLYAQNAIFPSEVSFSHSRINHICTFTGAIFLKEALFTRTLFRGASSFSGTRFQGETTFVGSNFAQGAAFNGAKFLDRANFRNARFEKQAFFSESTIGGSADFREVSFQDLTKFNSIIFNSSANFRCAKFSSEAHFGQTTFVKGVIFDDAEFCDRTLFTQIKSSAGFELRNGAVKRDFIFDGSQVSGLSDFSSSSFSGFTSFAECQFEQKNMEEKCGWVLFNECQFEKPTSFREVKFTGCFPEFGGAVLHPKTTFSAERRLWPTHMGQIASEARESFATIRHAVAQQGLPEDEHFFFRKEMHFAGQIGSFWQRLPYRTFGLFSDYGYSIAKPANALIALWSIGFAALWGYFLSVGYDGPAAGTAMALSLHNIIPIFGFGGQYFDKDFMEALPASLKFLSGVSRIFGFVFLFFLGLGLRTRFRLR